MSKRYLGETFDIHGGGLDLIFPHHENEIAQSRCAHGTKVMANYWMHNGFLQVEGQKMSKSLGNFVTINDVLQNWSGEVARLNMLRTHYRQPIDWTADSLEDSKNTLLTWQESIEDVEASQPDELFLEILSDDLNTHGAITRLHQLNKQKKDLSTFKASLSVLGFSLEFDKAKNKSDANVDRESIVRLIEDRLVARHTKNWKESDRIRDELDAMGIAIKDNKDGTTSWEVKR
jgi:cysteinyl-tRNA synthetase